MEGKNRSNAVGTNQSAGLTERAKEYFRVNIAILLSKMLNLRPGITFLAYLLSLLSLFPMLYNDNNNVMQV